MGGQSLTLLAGYDLADDSSLQTAGWGWALWNKRVVDKQLLHCMKGVGLPAEWHVGGAGPSPEGPWFAGPGRMYGDCCLDTEWPVAVLKWLPWRQWGWTKDSGVSQLEVTFSFSCRHRHMPHTQEDTHNRQARKQPTHPL